MELFDTILKAGANTGDMLGIQYGIVADVKDPLKLQRIQVYDQAKGGKFKSDWLIRGLPFTSFTPPVPKLGDLVVFGYILGDPHQGCYLGCGVNQVNKPVGGDNDLTVVLGGVTVSISSTGNVAVSGAKVVDIQSTTVNINTTGTLTLKANKVTFDSPDIDFGSTGSLKVAGKQVATIGAVDNAGNVITSRGW